MWVVNGGEMPYQVKARIRDWFKHRRWAWRAKWKRWREDWWKEDYLEYPIVNVSAYEDSDAIEADSAAGQVVSLGENPDFRMPDVPPQPFYGREFRGRSPDVGEAVACRPFIYRPKPKPTVQS